jgi:hypothetical protein
MELKPGDKFVDRYQLLSKLGEGGNGCAIISGLIDKCDPSCR